MMAEQQQQQQQHHHQQQQQRGNPVVHVRGDSETELDLLFSVLNNNDPKLHPFRNKNLPLSFFQPPEPKPGGGHSRDVSLDLGSQQIQMDAAGGGMTVYHGRSHSSPAKLPVSLSLAPPPPLPNIEQGGGTVASPSKYFINNSASGWLPDHCNSQDATAAILNQHFHNALVVGSSSSSSSSQNNHIQQSSSGGLLNLRVLPHGWDQAMTAEGEVYFIDHVNKTTSWYDPRLPRHLQKSVASKMLLASSRQQQQQQQNHLLPQQQQPPNQAPQPPGQLSKPCTGVSPMAPLSQLLKQQQQQPMLGGQMPTPQTVLGVNPLLQQGSASMMSGHGVPLNKQQAIEEQLQNVIENRERLKRLQEDCNREEQRLLKELMNHQTLETTLLGPAVAGNIRANLMSGNSLHHPQHHQQPQDNSEYAVNGISGSLGLDVPLLVETEMDRIPMDSDELVPSLTDEFSRDLLTMDIQMMDIFL